MRFLRPWYFLVTVSGVFLAHQCTERAGFRISLADNYLDDFLFLPLVFSLYLVLQKLRAPQLLFRFSLVQTAGAWIAASVWFEVLLPVLSLSYTRDIWDMVLYGAGAVFFYAMQQYWIFRPGSHRQGITSPGLQNRAFL